MFTRRAKAYSSFGSR